MLELYNFLGKLKQRIEIISLILYIIDIHIIRINIARSLIKK